MIVHLVGVVVVAVMLWGVAPHAVLLNWIAGLLVVAAASDGATRTGQTRRGAPGGTPAVTITAIAVALAWGVGAALVIPDLPVGYVAPVLLVLVGLTIHASATMASAATTPYRAVVVSLLAPPIIAVLVQGRGGFQIGAAGVMVAVAIGAVIAHRRLHQAPRYRRPVVAASESPEGTATRERALLDALFTSAPNAIAVVDSRGLFVDVNPSFEALFGYTRAEVLGEALADLIVPAAGRDAALGLQIRVRRGETIATETERCCKDGRLVTVRVSITRAAVDGEPLALFVYTDVTAVRRSEEALRASEARLAQVVASSSAVIYATKVEGDNFIPTWVSENLTRITGHQSEEALDPAWWPAHLHPGDRERVFGEIPRLYAENRLTTEYRFRSKDGPYRWIRDESQLVRDDAGQPHEIFGAWLDITDRKVAEETMLEARNLAERSSRASAAFLANMSHEIRTPMNAILGLTELVLDTELSAYQHRSLGMVRSAAETLLALLNDVLDFSKIEAEHLTLELIPFDLRYLLESTVSLLAVRTWDRPIELAADLGSDIPHTVCGDPTRLRQVLTNLVGNAIKFTSEGEVILSAAAVPGPEGQSCIRFAVRDTGIGIPADQISAIFEEFKQADASMTRKYGGTGLGLAIARRLVKLMGGELTVTSQAGHGSEFAFTLSLPVQDARSAPSPGVGHLAGQRTLVVDDNATNRRIIREMLGTVGVTAEEAPGANEGLVAIRQAHRDGRPYALAIIDAQMPHRDGFELATAIRGESELAGTRLLMLTSAGQRGDTKRCREVGIEGYLTKPASRTDLLEMAAALLDGGSRTPGADLVTRHSIAESRRRLRVLLAEDNAVNQEVAATMLRKRGHTVDVVNNGREAVDAVGRQHYDVVLMDIQMPEMDGFEATRAIRAGPTGSNLAIIALTAHALSGERERCLANGMTGYVPKPFRPHELFAAVENVGDSALAADPEPAPARSAVDIEGFRRSMREAGAEEAVDGILDMYAQNAPERLTELHEAVDATDAQAIAKAAHAFKSPSGSIGALRLAGLLQEMELAARNGAIDQARAAFEQVRSETEAVLQHLNARNGGATHGR